MCLVGVQSLSRVQLFVTPLTATCQVSLSFTISQICSNHVRWVGDAIQPSHPLSPVFLLSSIFPSIRVFSIVLALHIRWPKYYFLRCSLPGCLEGHFRKNWRWLSAAFSQYMWLLTHFCEGDHNILPQIMPFWHIGFFFFFSAKGSREISDTRRIHCPLLSAWKQNLNTLPTTIWGKETLITENGESYWD